jgi:hypothetical protein
MVASSKENSPFERYPVWVRRAALGCGALFLLQAVCIESVSAQAERLPKAAGKTGVTVVSDADRRPRSEPRSDQKALVVGSDLYPQATVATDQPRFDRSSNLLVNTIGARTGLFGAAAREGLTWANRYVPGSDVSGKVQLYSLSTSGNYGAFFGARSSDNMSSKDENVIGAIHLVVADSDRPHLHWATYSEGYVPRGKSNFRLLINDENSIQNEANPAPWADPYDVNPQQLLNNLRVDCGIGVEGAQSCTNPISVLNNGARYRTGILFGANSIDPVDGVATALALPTDYGLSWFAARGAPTWRLYSTARTVHAGSLVLGDDAVSIAVGQGAQPALRVEKDAIRTPAVISSGPMPAFSGSCPVREQRGGAAAGAFHFAQDCGDGTLVISFSVVAPNGWSCFSSDLTRGDAELRETAFTRTSATLSVLRVRKTDSAVFSCTGF